VLAFGAVLALLPLDSSPSWGMPAVGTRISKEERHST
jgi:hypothetical protein